MTDDLFDFGFTAVTESELEVVQNTEGEINSLQTRLDGVYLAILPLLENLKKNPDKDYIYWPDRSAKIDAFKEKLDSIYTGK